MTSGLDVHRDVVERVVEVARERLSGDAELVVTFLRRYYERVAVDDLEARDPRDLFGAAMTHLQLGLERAPRTPKLHLLNPDVDEHGWQSPHTVLDLVTDDMPFLVDSVSMVLSRYGYGLHLVVHPMLHAVRDGGGRLTAVEDAPPNEAWIHIELDRQASGERLDVLAAEVLAVLADVRAAVEDWTAMRDQALRVADAVEHADLPVPDAEVHEAAELLRWLADDHFTFLGYRDYDLVAAPDGDELRTVPGTGLGLLRDERRAPRTLRLADLAPEVRRRAREPRLLVVTRANSRSTVHRPEYLAYLSVKRFDEHGQVCGEQRFLGLYTALTYRGSASEVPYLRRKVLEVLRRSGFPPDSHDGRELWNILESFPRDELFQMSVDELARMALGILNLQERKQVRLFVRRDDYGRFVSCLVFVPRDRYSSIVLERMEAVLLDAFHGTGSEHVTSITDSVLARVHFLIGVDPSAPTDVDLGEVERRLAAVSRWWADELRDCLVESFGEDEGLRLLARYEEAFPAAYRERYAAAAAVHDIRRVELLGSDGLETALHHPVEAPDTDHRFKLYTHQPLALSDVLPLLEHMGVQVIDERPFEIRPAGGPSAWLYDFGVRSPAGGRLTEPAVRDQFRSAFTAAWRGAVESDGFNRLVLLAGLSADEVTVLRAYARYLRQVGVTFSAAYLEETLAAHPAIARRLVELFAVRFDPAFDGHRALESDGLAAEITAALDGVASLDQDRILRAFLALVLATVRTNRYRCDAAGERPPCLALKLDPALVPDLPLPRPVHEIWVYSPRVEGVHLRGGDVARGGIRWSDRREDFRTEVLGLMKAQMVKNAVIVPVGAKGGFVVKRPPADPEALRTEVVSCYRAFIGSLLDVTDNIVAGAVVPPADVVRHDGDDPYLVVAADKGTATFSDIANEIAAAYGFWLGDAFASGGSEGYDHKEMGITAKGAWESVRRHFLTLGVDADTAELTVVGIGDMSGDVFGNGLLCSPHLQLVAAFDHRHVFLDPNPDPARSYAERARLYALPRSSWDDYDRSAISAGGGVWPRSAKSVPLSPEVRERLAVESLSLTPAELISAILKAPVDLLWNGGIGTYVKATTETNAEVGDRANDALRVDGADLRCRVVGEGGNLGFTQRGRVEYALKGGLVNTDAIDNSAGVDCSDHEVNIKILLNAAVADGDLTEKQRNLVLVEMTDEVAELVLADNYAQNLALAIARTQSASMVDVHARYVRSLETEGELDRDLERLPTEKQFTERQGSGLGLTAPEFAVLLAYTKTTAVAELLRSDLPEDPYLHRYLVEYFPHRLRTEFADRMATHPLHRQIVATTVVNDMVNHAGTSFDYRIAEEHGAALADITRAHVAARDVFELPRHWAALEALDNVVASPVQLELFLELRRVVERGVVWLLRHRRPPLDIAATVAAFGPGVQTLAERLPDLLAGPKAAAVAANAKRLADAGVPPELAARAAAWPLLHTSFDVVELANGRGRTPEDAALAYWGLFDRLELAWLWDRIGALPRNDRWQAHARAALRDDLLAQLRSLTADVLRAGDVFSSPAELLDGWQQQNQRAVERAARAFADIRSAGAFDLTTLSVGLRQLQNLVLASRPTS